MRPQKQIAILGSFLMNPQSAEYPMAETLGLLLANRGFPIICGGHGGIADALICGVTRGGGRVRGISMAEAKFPRRSAPMNPLVTEVVRVNSIAERLDTLADSDGYIFFSGGIGTLAEFAFIWHSLQVTGNFERPLILISLGWKHLFAAIKQEMIKQKYYRMVHLCARAQDAVAILTNDYSLKYDEPAGLYYKKAVVFDFDGAIAESPEEIFVGLCENSGYFFPLPQVGAAFRKAQERCPATEGEIPFLRCVVEMLGIAGEEAADLGAVLAKEFPPVPELHPDAVAALRYFKESGLATGIASSRHPEQLRNLVSRLGVETLVDFLCPLDRADEAPLANTGYGRDETIFVGDDYHESTLGHRSVGVDRILLDRHLANMADGPMPAIRSLKELEYLVKSSRSG